MSISLLRIVSITTRYHLHRSHHLQHHHQAQVSPAAAKPKPKALAGPSPSLFTRRASYPTLFLFPSTSTATTDIRAVLRLGLQPQPQPQPLKPSASASQLTRLYIVDCLGGLHTLHTTLSEPRHPTSDCRYRHYRPRHSVRGIQHVTYCNPSNASTQLSTPTPTPPRPCTPHLTPPTRNPARFRRRTTLRLLPSPEFPVPHPTGGGN
jgi:hypothetical protein